VTDISKLSEAEVDALVEEMSQNIERARDASETDVIGALVECGMPRKDAEGQMTNSGMEWFARQFYLDYLDAKLGNPEAKERVERCREQWGKMTRRREEQR
jgi:hypothetical protein